LQGHILRMRLILFIEMLTPTKALQRRWNNSEAAPLSGCCPAGQAGGSDNLSAIVAADRAFPAAVAEL